MGENKSGTRESILGFEDLCSRATVTSGVESATQQDEEPQENPSGCLTKLQRQTSVSCTPQMKPG